MQRWRVVAEFDAVDCKQVEALIRGQVATVHTITSTPVMPCGCTTTMICDDCSEDLWRGTV